MATSHSLLMANSTPAPEQETEAERISAFKRALLELKMNSKPHISMLTMLAEAELNCPSAAEGIVRSIEQRLHDIRTRKLATQLELVNLYLIDSICKTVKGIYVELFTQNIVSNFVRTFEGGDEKIRISLFKLRSTWNDIFPPEKLLALDRKIKEIDPKWPIDPHTESAVGKLKQKATNESQIVPNTRGVHINPLFISSGATRLTDQANHNMRSQQLAKLKMQKEQAEKEAIKARVESESCKNQLNNQDNQFQSARVPIEPMPPVSGPRKRKRDKKRKGQRQEIHSPPRKMVDSHINSSQQLMPQVPQPLPPSQQMAPQPSGFYSRRPPINQNPNFYTNGNVVGPWMEPGAPFMPEYGSRRPIEWSDRDQRFAPGISGEVQPSVIYPEQQLIRPSTTFYQPTMVPATTMGHSIPPPIGASVVNLPPPVVPSVPQMPIVPSAPQVVSSALPTATGAYPFNSVNELLKVLTAGNSVIKNDSPGGPVPTSVVDATATMTVPTQCSSADQSKTGGSDGTNLAGTSLPLTSTEPSSQPPQNQWNALPAEAKLEWTTESLKSFRPSLVAGLYDGRQCTSCPLRFLNQDGQYTQHLDWHFRQNKKKKLKSKGAHSLSRPWYYKFELWLLFKEVCNEDDKSSKFFDADSGDLDQQNPSNNEKATNTMVKAREEESDNLCHVCSEKFQSVWHEEDEVWILKNAIEKNGNIYHPTCLSDATASYDQTANTSLELDSSEREVSLEIKDEPVNDHESKEENISDELMIKEENDPMQEPMQVDDEEFNSVVKVKEVSPEEQEDEKEDENENEIEDDKAVTVEQELKDEDLERSNDEMTGSQDPSHQVQSDTPELNNIIIKSEPDQEEEREEKVKSEEMTEICDHSDEKSSENCESETSTSPNTTTTNTEPMETIITTASTAETIAVTDTATATTSATMTTVPSPTPVSICVPDGPVVISGKERSALCAIM